MKKQKEIKFLTFKVLLWNLKDADIHVNEPYLYITSWILKLIISE